MWSSKVLLRGATGVRRAQRLLPTLHRRYFGADRATQAVLDAAKACLNPHELGQPPRVPPSPSAVRKAVAATVANKSGYQAWSLYTALRQCNVELAGSDIDSLAGAMLHVDHELHADLAAGRTLSVLDAERLAGRTPSVALLIHCAAACALQGLPDLAESLCDEAEARQGGRPHLSMRAALIRACGAAEQLPRAFTTYRGLEERLGRKPPGGQPALALLSACVSAGELDSGFDVLEELRGCNDFVVKAGALTPLLRGCAEQGDVPRAKWLLKLAKEARVEVSAAAVREFARAGGPFLSMGASIACEARREGQRLPLGSTTKLVRACLLAGDAAAAAEVLRITDGDDPLPSRQREGGNGGTASAADAESLDSAFELLHSVVRQEYQAAGAEADVRHHQRPWLGIDLPDPATGDDMDTGAADTSASPSASCDTVQGPMQDSGR